MGMIEDVPTFITKSSKARWCEHEHERREEFTIQYHTLVKHTCLYCGRVHQGIEEQPRGPRRNKS